MAELKVWGSTTPVAIENGLHMHLIRFIAGGVCSEHYHQHRHNLFYVISGQLLIRTWAWHDDDGVRRVTEQILRRGQTLSVPAMRRHQFEAIESGEALEIYWHNASDREVDPYDIVRFTQGFMR